MLGDWWWQMLRVFREEFSDISDVGEATRITLRLLMAGILSGILGWERERRGKSAGMRTHMLVAMGAALFVMIPQQAGMAIPDLSRVLQGLVAGVGFLGAGMIIRGSGAVEIKGLTTAAGIWMTAAIGVAAGMGREATAVLSTVLALLILCAVSRETRRSEAREGDSEGATTSASVGAVAGVELTRRNEKVP